MARIQPSSSPALPAPTAAQRDLEAGQYAPLGPEASCDPPCRADELCRGGEGAGCVDRCLDDGDCSSDRARPPPAAADGEEGPMDVCLGDGGCSRTRSRAAAKSVKAAPKKEAPKKSPVVVPPVPTEAEFKMGKTISEAAPKKAKAKAASNAYDSSSGRRASKYDDILNSNTVEIDYAEFGIVKLEKGK